MEPRTYYDILGVSRDATLDEITNAKNALAKVYHPDANMYTGIDTTAYMQNILEAFRTLSNPDKRQKYDQKLGDQCARVFRTFTVGHTEQEEDTSFVTYWNAAAKLNELVLQSVSLIEESTKKLSFWTRILQIITRKKNSADIHDQLSCLSLQAVQYISILKSAEICMNHWSMDAMNWVLVRWGQKQNMDYQVLFAKYDAFEEQSKSKTEKIKIHAKRRQFSNQLKKLLNYAITSDPTKSL